MSRPRAAVEARDAENPALRAGLEKVLARLDAALAEAAAGREQRERLELTVAELERRLPMDSTDSGTPSSKERIGAREARRARQQSERERRKDRKRGGQPGHQGKGIQRDPDPDENKDAERPAQCRRCRAGLQGAGPAESAVGAGHRRGGPPLNPLLAPAGSRRNQPAVEGTKVMDEITEEPAALVERIAALDIGKATLTACVRMPHEDKPGARRQEVRTYATRIPALLELRDWLICQGVTLVVMEATSAYWKPPFYLLEDDIECWVVNARDVKNDLLDSVWLAKLAERGMLRASFIPSRPQRQLRDLTRYRRTLTQERTREKQRAEKLLEAQIKLSSVISDIFGVSARAMLDALIAGQRNPRELAALA